MIGFLKEHDNIDEADYFKDIIGDEITQNIVKILAYLDQGEMVFAWMGYVMDLETNAPLCPMGYYTDGIWVWTDYFRHYLGRIPTCKFDAEFLDYLREKKFEFSLDENYSKNRDAIEDQGLRVVNPMQERV